MIVWRKTPGDKRLPCIMKIPPTSSYFKVFQFLTINAPAKSKPDTYKQCGLLTVALSMSINYRRCMQIYSYIFVYQS